jgi:hypothetical protein
MRWLIAIAASSLVLVASAIEAPKPAPGTAPAKVDPSKDQPAETPPAAPSENSPAEVQPAGDASETPDSAAPVEEEEELPPLPPGTAPSGPPPARFDPTEKVRADFPVSFPIDI